MLIGRNPDKIKPRKEQLEKYYPGIRFEVIEADMIVDEDIERMKEEILRLKQRVDIGIVINNVGMAIKN